MNKLSQWLLCTALLGTLAACSERNIHTELTDDSRVLTRRWVLQTHTGPYEAADHGTEFSNPVMAGNTLVFGNRSVGLIALYPGINSQRWVLPIKNGVVSPLTVDHDQVFFGGGDGFLYCVSLDNGRVVWRYDLRNPIISSPTVSGGRVFVTSSDDTVYAFDSGTGKWLWHYRRRSAQSATIHGASSPLVDGTEVLAGLSDGFLVSLSIADGQLKWERKLHQGTKFTDVDAHPVLENGILYVPSYDGALYALKRQGGDIIWRFDAGGSKDVILEDQRIFLPSSDGYVYAIQKNSAKILWKFELDHGTPTQMVSTSKYLIFGSSYQYLYVVDKETGKGVYRFNVGSESGFYGSPFYDPTKGWVYILSCSGNLYSFILTKQPPSYRHAVISAN